jgi:protein phosphatase PTC1
MIVRLDKSALVTAANDSAAAIGVEGDPPSQTGKISEVEKIVGDAKRKGESDGSPGLGVSGSNSGKGHDPKPIGEDAVRQISMEKVVEENPDMVACEAGPEIDLEGANAISLETRVKLKLPEGALK